LPLWLLTRVGGPPPPLASFFGFRSRTLMSFLVFFFFSSILTFLSWVVCCLCCITGTEQQLTPANDILFWDQVIETDQFFLFALWPLTRWLSGGRISFVLRFAHFDHLLPIFVPSFFPSGVLSALMACFQRVTTTNIYHGQRWTQLQRAHSECRPAHL
jgi:hypothetical protein